MCLCKCAGTSLGCMSPCKEQSSGWCLLSTSQDIAQWPSKEIVYTPTNIIWTPGLHLLFSLFYFFNQIMCVKWYLVLTCISLIITGEPDSLFMFVDHLGFQFSNVPVHIDCFSIIFFGGVFFLLIYIISLCILATSPPNPRESSARKREGRRQCVWRGWWWDKKQPHLFYCSLKPSLNKWKANHKLRKNICNAHICQRTCILNI